jgi:hypothetical protein
MKQGEETRGDKGIKETKEWGIGTSKKQKTKEGNKTLRKERSKNRAGFWALYRSQNKGPE